MKKFFNLFRIIHNKIIRFRRLLETNPFKVAELWRKMGVQIGVNTCVYRNVVISGERKEPVIIGDNCVLTGCALLAHDASTNRYLGIKYGAPSITQPIIIEDNCFIGYGAIILMGIKIGHDSIIGASAIVTQNIPPRSVVGGNPARIICTVDKLIEKRKALIESHPEYVAHRKE